MRKVPPAKTGASPKKNDRGKAAEKVRALSARAAFDALFTKGKKISGQFINGRILFDQDAGIQFAVMVSRKAEAKAVNRNRWKRRLREIFRKLTPRLKPGTWVLFQVRQGAGRPEYQALKTDVVMILQQGNAFL